MLIFFIFFYFSRHCSRKQTLAVWKSVRPLELPRASRQDRLVQHDRGDRSWLGHLLCHHRRTQGPQQKSLANGGADGGSAEGRVFLPRMRVRGKSFTLLCFFYYFQRHFLIENILSMINLAFLAVSREYKCCRVFRRLYALQGALSQQEWRVAELYRRLLQYLRSFLSHPFQNVRERVAGSVAFKIIFWWLPKNCIEYNFFICLQRLDQYFSTWHQTAWRDDLGASRRGLHSGNSSAARDFVFVDFCKQRTQK